MKRRGSGEGTIFQRSDGRWSGQISVNYQRRTVYGKAHADVVKKLSRLRVKAEQGKLTGTNRQAVGAFLDQWLDGTVRPSVRYSTFAMYSGVVRLYLKPLLGDLQLSRLSAQHVRKMLADLEQPFGKDLRRPKGRRRAGISARTRQIVRGVLHRALRQAVRDGILEVNAVANVDRPRASRPPIRTLDPKQARRFLEFAKDHRLYALFHLAISTGARQGELLALQWRDVNLEKGTVSIQHTLTRSENGEWSRAEPKTAGGKRQIELSALEVRVLKDHRDRHPSLPWVFCDQDGGPLKKEHLVRHELLPILKAALLPAIRFHDLRHTAATLMLGEGVNPKIVAERLGHADIRMTLDTYSHVTPTMQREAAERVAALLG